MKVSINSVVWKGDEICKQNIKQLKNLFSNIIKSTRKCTPFINLLKSVYNPPKT